MWRRGKKERGEGRVLEKRKERDKNLREKFEREKKNKEEEKEEEKEKLRNEESVEEEKNSRCGSVRGTTRLPGMFFLTFFYSSFI